MVVTEDNEKIILEGILHAMSVSEEDVIDDFHESISKSNKNGLPFAVWARRSDVLDNHFQNFDSVEVFHIKRTKLWQIDPVFDHSSGILYLLFSDVNLAQVRNKYVKKGKSTHYSVSFILTNMGLLPMENEQLEFIPSSEEEIADENARRKKDIEKMIGSKGELIKKTVFVSVSYHNGEAIAALLQEYTPDFELAGEVDISYMLQTQYFGDNDMDDNASESVESEQPLVKLKDISKNQDE